MHLETQRFIETVLFAVSSASIPLVLNFSMHLTNKTHTCKIFLYPSLILAVFCFFITIIGQLISFSITKKVYEALYKANEYKEKNKELADNLKKSAKTKMELADFLKKFYYITFILGLTFSFLTIILHLFEPFAKF